MLESAASIALGAILFFGDGTIPVAGVLTVPPARKDAEPGAIPYLPREGDLVFYDDRSPVWLPLFALAGTGPPLHMGMVVRKADGKLAVLEAGPDDTLWVALLDLGPRLKQFHDAFPDGTIMIRRCKTALSRDRSAALTKFAEAQKGKRYAVLRLLSQGTKFRVRGPLEQLLGGTELDRSSWTCAELAVAAGTVVELFDPRTVKANVTYPRDLVDNRRHDLSAAWQDAARWQPIVKGKR
jgi:hypothetical protein